LKEIIDEIKTDFNARKEEKAKKRAGQDSTRKMEKNDGGGDSEGKKRKRKGEAEGGEVAAHRMTVDVPETVDMEDDVKDSEIDLSADKVKDKAEVKTEVKAEVETEVEGRRAAARAALASLTFLRRLSGGRVVVVVKDERTTSQLRDYLIHGEVREVRREEMESRWFIERLPRWFVCIVIMVSYTTLHYTTLHYTLLYLAALYCMPSISLSLSSSLQVFSLSMRRTLLFSPLLSPLLPPPPPPPLHLSLLSLFHTSTPCSSSFPSLLASCFRSLLWTRDTGGSYHSRQRSSSRTHLTAITSGGPFSQPQCDHIYYYSAQPSPAQPSPAQSNLIPSHPLEQAASGLVK
jgi:hypothetical protein